MKEKNIEKEVKIISVFIMLAGLSLLVINIYFIYCKGSLEDWLDIYYLLFGSLLIIAGFGLYKNKSWARKMMLYTMAVHLLVGGINLFNSIRIILPPKIDSMNIDCHLSIKFILAIVIAFVISAVIPAVCVFAFLSRKEIKYLFTKRIVSTQSGG